MLKFIPEAYKILLLLLSGLGLFLSAWIVIPAPTFSLLPLSVGAPEVSPWLVGLNAIAILLALTSKMIWLRRVALAFGVAGLIVSLLPVSQLPATNRQADTAMVQALGADYLTKIPQSVQAQMRPQPFVLADVFRGIPTRQVRYTSGIPFAAPDGVSLTLDIYQPPQVGRYPAIVVIYGGAWQRGSPSDNAEFNRYMAARGYVVWAIAYRHAPRYRFPAQIEDVQAALAFIQQHATEYETDLERIALLGRSAGAHLAMLAAYRPDAPRIRAVVNYYGPVNLTKGYYDLPHPDPIDVRAVLKAFLGGSPDELPELYRQASPISYVSQPQPPSLLVYGGQDHIIQAKFGRTLGDRLQAVGSQVIFLEIPWAEHAFDAVFNGVSNQLALYYTERFLAWALQL
ncbi:MAG TPA: alpha/beta hydrolase [Chroococcales cyanobacterium]|jgi:acetyl esterase/lipase